MYIFYGNRIIKYVRHMINFNIIALPIIYSPVERVNHPSTAMVTGHPNFSLNPGMPHVNDFCLIEILPVNMLTSPTRI